MKLRGKTALITGGTSGIGLATAKLFLREGASVIVTARDISRLTTELKESDDVVALECDISKMDDLDLMIESVSQSTDKIDILFANAGNYRPMKFIDIDEEYFDDLVSTNLKGTFFSIRKMVPMLDKGSCIIINSSVSGYTPLGDSSLYSAVKAGLHALTRNIAKEMSSLGIRVNSVSPGQINTPLSPVNKNLKGAEIWAKKKVPAGRVGQPEDVAKAVLFLASDEANYIYGEDLLVDGGAVRAGL